MADDFLAEYIAAGGPDLDHLRNVLQFIVHQDLTPLSEPDRAAVLHRAHLALGLPPESGTVVAMEGEYNIGGKTVPVLRPYVNTEGLNRLATRYGARTRVLSTAIHENGVVVTMRAELPGGRFRERAGYCTAAFAAGKGRPPLDIALERASNQSLYGLFGLPLPDDSLGELYLRRQVAKIKEGLGAEVSRVEGDPVGAEGPGSAADTAPTPEEVEVASPSQNTPAAPPDVDPELASIEAMGMGDPNFDCIAPPDLAAAEASNSLPPGWEVAERTRRRRPWPYGKSRVTSPGEMEPPPPQVNAYIKLLVDRGLTSGEAQSQFTGRLVTGADIPLNPYVMPVRDLRRCMDMVQSLASPDEMEAFDAALADRGYLSGPERDQKLLKLVGVKTPRDREFLTSRDVANAMRSLSDEPTLTQIAECEILMEHLGVKEPKLQELQAMEYLGRTDPVPLRSLSAKEIGQCIGTMAPSVQGMKTKTMFPTNRQHYRPWSPKL